MWENAPPPGLRRLASVVPGRLSRGGAKWQAAPRVAFSRCLPVNSAQKKNAEERREQREEGREKREERREKREEGKGKKKEGRMNREDAKENSEE